MKRCTKCGETKPLDDFYKDKKGKKGLSAQCKMCTKAVSKDWRKANPEKSAANSKEWAQAHPEKRAITNKTYYDANVEEILEKGRVYREENPEKRKATTKAYRETYPERVAASGKAYKEANPERRKETVKAYYDSHSEQLAAYAASRRQKCNNMSDLDKRKSAAYREQIKDDPCFYCGETTEVMHIDHYFPLALGGTDHWFNLVRACSFHNLSKGAKLASVWCATLS